MVFDNLDILRQRLETIVEGRVVPVDVQRPNLGSLGTAVVDKIPRVETGGWPVMIISLLYHDVVAAGELASSGFPQADATVYKLSRPEFESHLEAIGNEGQGSEVILLNSAAAENTCQGTCYLLLTTAAPAQC